MKQQFMELNRETAMRLWNKSFGKESKVKDFAGRTMAKGAYNDRNSEYGWNVDHILPQSKGGVTADHNLVCCHILTNDEKADKFPCFKANGIAFEIIKVERHYEIHKKDKKEKPTYKQEGINFYDSAAGIRLFKSLKGIQNKKRFVGTVIVYLKSVTNGAVTDFIEKIFDKETITYDVKSSYSNLYKEVMFNSGKQLDNKFDIRITITNYDMPKKSDTDELLDKCVLLRTYLLAYFLECEYISAYDIYYRGDYFETKADLFGLQSIKESNNGSRYSSFHDSLFINERILINTEAESKVQKNAYSEYTEYNYVYSNLKENLMKEANG